MEGNGSDLVTRLFKATSELLEKNLKPIIAKLRELEGKIAAIPAGKDGKDVDPLIIVNAINEGLKNLPVPKDGAPGKDVNVDDVVKTALQIMVDELPGHIEKIITIDKVAEAAAQKVFINVELIEEVVKGVVAELPPAKDGKDADVAEITAQVIAAFPVEHLTQTAAQKVEIDVEAMVKQLVAELPKVKDGVPGKDADPELIKQLVTDAVAALPPAKDGKDADPELIKRLVTDAVAALPPAKDGKDADLAVVKEIVKPLVAEAAKSIADQVTEAVAEIPVPKDGAPGKDADPVVIKKLVDEAVWAAAASAAEAVAVEINKIPQPKDGTPGKDADPVVIEMMVKEAIGKIPIPVAIEGESAFDLAVKHGFAGTEEQWVASLKGKDGFGIQGEPGARGKQGPPGIARDGRDGKSADDPAVLAAAAELAIQKLFGLIEETVVSVGDGRHFIRRLTLPGGKVLDAAFYQPAQIYRGVWATDREYELGDTVSVGGSQWYCRAEKTRERPKERHGNDDGDWVLSVKRGLDGRDAIGELKTPVESQVRLR